MLSDERKFGYDELRCTEFYYAGCQYVECQYAECQYAECQYARCIYPEFSRAECHKQ